MCYMGGNRFSEDMQVISEVAGQYNAHELEDQIRGLWERADLPPCQAASSWRQEVLLRGRPALHHRRDPPRHRLEQGDQGRSAALSLHERLRGQGPGRLGYAACPSRSRWRRCFGFQDKKDIEAYGVDKFIARCKEFALRQKDDMTAQFKMLGAWLDWDDPYMTLKNEYLEAAWWTLKGA